jgi:hypothetical protein
VLQQLLVWFVVGAASFYLGRKLFGQPKAKPSNKPDVPVAALTRKRPGPAAAPAEDAEQGPSCH